MDTPNTNPVPIPVPASADGLSTNAVAPTWEFGHSVYGVKDELRGTRLALRWGSSMAPLLIGLVFLVFLSVQAVKAVQDKKPEKYDIVFLPDPGRGGGGGGSPQPPPPKKLEIPKPKPVMPTPSLVPPPPSLNAPVETTLADLLQAAGVAGMSAADIGGGGSGGGIGSGHGNGVGPGEGGGFGGGVYSPGNGVSIPELIRHPDPKYTSDAMRAKIQGTVQLEGTVDITGH